MAKLIRPFRDNQGVQHRRGEEVITLGMVKDAATDRQLLKVVFAEDAERRTIFLLPSDIEEEDASN